MAKKILTGYVKPSDQSNYQFIYGTQSRGKFFNIYVRFTLNDSKDTITKLDFYLKNYTKGNGYEFKNIDIDCSKNLLKIACVFTKFGSLTEITKNNLNIQLCEFQQVFVTRDRKHINSLKSITKEQAENYRNDNSLEDTDILEHDFNFFEKIKDILKQDLTNEKVENTLENIKKLDSVGENCRVSLIETTEG